MPLFSYFLTAGSLLAGLMYYASSVMAPTVPIHVSQISGLPPPFKAAPYNPPPPVAAALAPKVVPVRADTAAAAPQQTELPKPVRKAKAAAAVRPSHKTAGAVRPSANHVRYADYPPRVQQGFFW